MTGDRSGYRKMYPSILSYNKREWDQEIKRTTDQAQAAWLKNLAEDTLRIKNGVISAKWPDKQFMPLLRDYTEHICKTRITRGKKLSRQDIATLEQGGMNRERVFVTVPQSRLAVVKSMKSAFDVIDPELRDSDYPVVDDVLDLTHDFITRGHGWFGVGEWSMANRSYLNGLLWALASNNLPTIEMLVRFSVDTYAALGDYQSAVNMASDFSRSSFTEIARITEFQNRNDTYESVVISLALNNLPQEVSSWLDRVRSELGREPNLHILDWNIVALLSEVYEFRQDENSLRGLHSTVNTLRSLMSTTAKQSAGAQPTESMTSNSSPRVQQMGQDTLSPQGILSDSGDINNEMTKQAEYAATTAKVKFGRTLDFSEDSLVPLEALLDQAYQRFSQLAKEGKLRDEVVQRTASVWGSYLGEVVRRKWGGTWLRKANDATLEIDGNDVSPIAFVYQRITRQPQYKTSQYYAEVTAKLKTRNQKQSQPSVSFLKKIFGKSEPGPAEPQQIDVKAQVEQIVNEGVQLKRQGDFAGAKRAYLRAIQLDPTRRMPFWALAKVCYLLGEQQEAILNYLRAAHLTLPGLAQMVAENPALRQQLGQVAPDVQAHFKHKHKLAPYLLFDPDTPTHLAHAMFDLDHVLPKSDAVKRYIPVYRSVLAGQGGALDDQLDEEGYRPMGIEFLLGNIQWQRIDDPQVVEIYPSIDSLPQYRADEMYRSATGVPDQHQSQMAEEQVKSKTVTNPISPVEMKNPNQTPDQSTDRQVAKIEPSVARGNTITIRGKEFTPYYAPIIVREGELPEIGISMNSVIFRCPMVRRTSDGGVEPCNIALAIPLEFVPSAWWCPACGGLMILDQEMRSKTYKHAHDSVYIDSDLWLHLYYNDKLRHANQVKFERWLSKVTQNQPALVAYACAEDQFTNLLGARILVCPQFFTRLDDLKQFQGEITDGIKRYAAWHLQMAVKAERRGNIDDAIAELETSLRLYSAYAEAHYNLGVLYREREQADQAIAEYKAAIQVQPDYAEAHHNLGVIYGTQGRIEEAIHELEEALRIDPTDPETHGSLGMAYGLQGRPDDEIREYQEAIRLNPNEAQAHHNLSVTYGQLGRLEEAIAEAESAVRLGLPVSTQWLATLQQRAEQKQQNAELAWKDEEGSSIPWKDVTEESYQQELNDDPNNLEAHTRLGNHYLIEGRLYDALREYQAALKISPDYAEAHLGMGNVYVEQGLEDKAISEYQEAIRIRPSFEVAHRNLVAVKRGRPSDVVRQFQTVLRSRPDDAKAHLDLAETYAMKGLGDEAVSELREAIRIKPDDPEAHFRLADAYFQQDRFEESMREWKEAIRFNPNLANAHFGLGLAFDRLEQSHNAICEYQEALRLKPELNEAHINLSAIYGRQSRWDDSARECLAVLRADPNHVSAHMNLSIAHWERGFRDKCVSELETVLRIDPNQAGAHVNLSVALWEQGQADKAIAEAQTAVRLGNEQARQVLAEYQRLRGRTG